jgi:HTH-type transcriptional regulator / antitoxin HipB
MVKMCNSLHIMNTNEIIAAIIEQRRALRLTQEELAQRAGLSRRTIVAIEAGTHDIGLRKLLRILDSLGLALSLRSNRRRPSEGELSELFGGDDE